MRKFWIFSLFLALGLQAQKKDITLMDIWGSGVFFPNHVGGFVNLSDGASYGRLESEGKNSMVYKYDYVSGERTGVVIDGNKIAQGIGSESFNFSKFQLSADESKALIEFNAVSIYRHSTRAMAIVVDLKNYQVTKVNKSAVRYPTLDPTATKVAYVMDNDLYIFDLIKNKTKRITKDGEYNHIINGAVDWVYEEEFSMSRGFQWNANGTKLAYFRFDESKVRQWYMPIYGELYPEQSSFKYPKAGEDNSVVDVYITNLKGKSTKLELGSERDQYLPRIKWTNDPNVLTVQRLNRLQNHWELLLVNEKGEVSVSLDEESEYYVDITDNIHFLSDGKHMIVNSEKDGYNHLYFHKVDGPQVFQITKGKWDVEDVLAVDEKNELVYYTSCEVSPITRHIYVVGFDGKGKKRLTNGSGFHSAKFSTDMSLCLYSVSTAANGIVYEIRKANWDLVRVVEDNQDFRDRLAEYNMSPIEFGSLTTDEEVNLNYWMIKPSQMDSGKQYPLFMYVYGGPGSQTVFDRFFYSNYFWFQMLANKYNIVIASVDNRGTGARGVEFKKMTYKQLGKYETIDQIASAKYFSGLDYIDGSRIGIFGWSYGGYMSSLALAKGNDVFKMAIAVAPVTNWRYYDNVYTERYMQRPQENGAGYDENSPITWVKDIKGKYLIIHGTGDDNVHFQNSVMMVDELVKNNIPFDSEFYPNKNHGIYGGLTRLHLYTRMTNFIIENL